MKICVTSTGSDLDSIIDNRFGRCLYFIFVDSKNFKKFDAVSNTGTGAMRGAGITAAQIVVNQGAEVVITGNIGPNAFGVLGTSGIRIFQAVSGTKIKDVLTAFKQEQLPEITQPLGGGFGRGLGRGGGPMGSGSGLGRGRKGRE